MKMKLDFENIINNSKKCSKKLSKFKVLDLFCGMGGLSLGFKWAGFDVLGGIDIDEHALRTYSQISKPINLDLARCNQIIRYVKLLFQ